MLLFGLPISALLIYVFFGYYVYREYISYRPILENNFPSSLGANIHGVIEPTGEVKNTILFSAHHDSALIPSVDNKGFKDSFLKVTLPLILFGASAFCLVVQLIVEVVSNRVFSIGFPPVSSICFYFIIINEFFILFSYFKNIFQTKAL